MHQKIIFIIMKYKIIKKKVSNTFDIKKIVPEIIVIIVAGGVLLFCITKES